MEPQEKILQKAFELFKRYGIRSVTMDEIAGQCGVSKKTVYHYFEDKESLVSAVMDNMISKTEICCKTHSQIAENAVHEIFLTADMIQEMMEGINPILMYDLRKYYNTAFAQLEKHKQQFIYSILKANMEKGIAEGLYREDIKVDVLTRYQIHNMAVAFEEDIFPKSKYTVTELDYELTLYNLYGLATSKGAKLIEKYKQQRLKQQTA
jgi:AcrR family transcriptional regulator